MTQALTVVVTSSTRRPGGAVARGLVVEVANFATTADVAARRTVERLPELMRGLIEQLGAARPDPTAQLTGLRTQSDVARLVTAIPLFKESVYALIGERQARET